MAYFTSSFVLQYHKLQQLFIYWVSPDSPNFVNNFATFLIENRDKFMSDIIFPSLIELSF